MLIRLEGAPSGASLPLAEVLGNLPFDRKGWSPLSRLLLVDHLGGACHTGRRSCFYNAVKIDRVEVISNPLQLPIHPNQK